MNRPANHLTDDEIARYSARKLPPSELLAADTHLAQCDDCFARAQSQADGDKLLLASNAFGEALQYDESHLSYEQLASLADEQLNDIDREIAESHLEVCAPCGAELSDLLEVKAKMSTVAVRESAHARSPSIRETRIAFWRLPAFRIPALSAAALAALALLAFLISIPWRRENAALQIRVAELEQRNDALKEEASRNEALQNEVAALRGENDRLRQPQPGEGSSVIALNDGGARITLDAHGNLAGLATPGYEPLVREALQSGRVKISTALTGSAGKTGTLMGDSASTGFRLLAPVNIVVETGRPTFRWQGLDGVATFLVTVFDQNLKKVAESESLIETEWTPASSLRRGQTYFWQVRASADNREIVAPASAAARVKFKVLEQTKMEELATARRAYPNSHLVLGLLCANAGLLDEAEREFEALVKANPQSTVSRKLLGSVKAARR